MINLNKLKKSNLNENLIIFFSLPIVINFLLTFNEEYKLKILKYFLLSLPFTFLLFLIFFTIGKNLKKILNLETTSFGIALIFGTIFIFDNIFLFFTSNFTFRNLIYTYFLFLFIFFFINKNKLPNLYNIFTPLFLILIINFLSSKGYFFSQYLDLFTSDENRLWIPSTEKIYQDNYFTALNFSTIEGYGIYAAHIKAFISVISSTNNLFLYNASISNLFLLFFFLVIYESNSNKKLKTLLFILFFSIFFTNNWVNYLFFNSLLGEGPACFIFGTTIIEITRSKRKIPLYMILFLAFNIYGKNFLTVVTVFLIFFFFIKYKNVFYLIVGAIPIFITLINSHMFEIGYLWQFYFSDDNTQRSEQLWSPKNFLEIFKEFYIDKTLTLVFILMFILYIFSKNKLERFFKIENLDETIFYVNIFIVFVVYIFLVKELEAIRDSYRYLINTLYTIPITLTKYAGTNR